MVILPYEMKIMLNKEEIKMPVLDCNVTSCIHNANERCCKGNILIEGAEAKDSNATCCASYYEREEDSYRNQYESPDTALQVDCEAHHCRFNSDNECHAEHIGIAGNNATCCDETRCASFQCTCGCR